MLHLLIVCAVAAAVALLVLAGCAVVVALELRRARRGAAVYWGKVHGTLIAVRELAQRASRRGGDVRWADLLESRH